MNRKYSIKELVGLIGTFDDTVAENSVAMHVGEGVIATVDPDTCQMIREFTAVEFYIRQKIWRILKKIK